PRSSLSALSSAPPRHRHRPRAGRIRGQGDWSPVWFYVVRRRASRASNLAASTGSSLSQQAPPSFRGIAIPVGGRSDSGNAFQFADDQIQISKRDPFSLTRPLTGLVSVVR